MVPASSEEVQRVHEYLSNKSLQASKEWLEGCIGYYKDQNSHYTFTALVNFVEEQWKLADLRDVSEGCLPQALASKLNVTLTGQYSLQIESVINIGQSAYGQLQKMQQVNTMNLEVTEEKQQKWEPKESRMLKLYLSDGVQEIEAIEYSHINFLNLNIVPGTKVVLIGPVNCRRGIILLKPQNIKVLGGEVDTLLLSNAPEKVLARKLNIPENTQQLTNTNNAEYRESINGDTLERQQEDWPGADDDFNLADVDQLEQLETGQTAQVSRNADPLFAENRIRIPHELVRDTTLSRNENTAHSSNQSSSIVTHKPQNSNLNFGKLPMRTSSRTGIEQENKWPDEGDQDLDILWHQQDDNIEHSEDRNLHSNEAKFKEKQSNFLSTRNENDWLGPDDDFDFAQIDQLEQQLKVRKPPPATVSEPSGYPVFASSSSASLPSVKLIPAATSKPTAKIQSKLLGYIKRETCNVPSSKATPSLPNAGVSHKKPYVNNSQLYNLAPSTKVKPEVLHGESFVGRAQPKSHAFCSNIRKEEVDWEDIDEITLPKDVDTLVEGMPESRKYNYSKVPEISEYRSPLPPLEGPLNCSYTEKENPKGEEPFISKRTYHQDDTVRLTRKTEESTKHLSWKLPSLTNTAKTLGNDRSANIPTLVCSPEDVEEIDGTEENIAGDPRPSPPPSDSRPSLRNLKQVLMSHARNSGTYTVKVLIETLISRLTVSLPDGWDLKARISDGSDTLDVKFSSDVLEKMIGFSAFEFREFKRSMSGNPLVKERVVKALQDTQEKLKNLRSPVEIKYGPPLEIPCVVNVLNDAMEDCL